MKPFVTSILVAIATSLAVGSCAETPAAPHSASAAPTPASPTATPSKPAAVLTPPAVDASAPAAYPGLHNVVTYHAGLYSGSMPEGDEGFESLVRLGVQTVISVDGAAPEVDRARAHGLRYVHLPIAYNGVSPERTLELARAIHDLPGSVYVHCHHGKHRSAGALGVAAITLGYMTPEQAKARMRVSGTAENYKGLYQCVAVASPVDAATLARASNAFPEVTKTSGLVATMTLVDEHFDSLKAVEKAQWTVPADHPDVVPQIVAGELESLFRNVAADPEVRDRPEDFQEWLADAAGQSRAIEDELKKPAPSTEKLAGQFRLLGQSCKQCHVKYRD